MGTRAEKYEVSLEAILIVLISYLSGKQWFRYKRGTFIPQKTLNKTLRKYMQLNPISTNLSNLR